LFFPVSPEIFARELTRISRILFLISFAPLLLQREIHFVSRFRSKDAKFL